LENKLSKEIAVLKNVLQGGKAFLGCGFRLLSYCQFALGCFPLVHRFFRLHLI
jgi:hypothetical protein